MTRGKRLLVFAAAAAAGALALGAAQRPGPLAQASPGLWEISGVPGTRAPAHECLGDLSMLAHYEHRRDNCTSRIISDSPSQSVVEYSCGGAGFGRSDLKLITPRSLRIDTQGISDNLPFGYVLQARRVGDCPTQASAKTH
jgi:hypothetical protein